MKCEVLIFLALFIAVHSQVCPSGWSVRPGDRSWCYLYTNNSRAKNWADAKAACEAKKAQLLKIDNLPLQTWVTQELAKRTKIDPYHRHFWVGLNKLADKKTWVWTDRSKLNPRVVKWYPKNPNNVKYQFCAGLYSSKSATLTDETCSVPFPYICQRRTNIPLYCDSNDGWETADGVCYKYMDYRRTWSDAKTSCEGVGATLATILDDNDAAMVRDHARENQRDVWIGLYSQPDPSTRFHWQWANGSTTIPSKYWKLPVTVPTGQENSSCAAVSSTISSTQSWTVSSCYEEKMYVCEKPEGSCAPGWKSFGTNCYQFNTLFSMSFDSAMRHCGAQSARLVEIYNEDDQNFINQYLPDYRAANLWSLWIGIYDRDWDVYKYTSGRAIGAYNNWAKKPPPNTPNLRECVYINTGNKPQYNASLGPYLIPNIGDRYGRWNIGTDCLQAKPFICFASSRTVIRLASTPAPQIRCSGGGYIAFGTTCWKFVDQAVTFLFAREACQKDGGDLATINDDATQVFVRDRLRADKWIGLNDKGKEGTWTWLDQSTPTTYTNWSPDRDTSSPHGDQNCVIAQGSATKRGKWLDRPCVEKHGYVCQKPSLTLPPTTTPSIATTEWTVNCGPFWEEHASLGHCYQFRTEQYTFLNSRQSCLHQGGDIASITSLAEQTYIEARVKSMSVGSFWIGATDKDNEGGWSWMDSSPFSYLNWAPGQPDDYNNNQDCARLITQSGLWDDSICFNRYAYICKKTSKAAMTTRPPPTKPLTAPAGKYLGCPPGYLPFQGNCYGIRKTKMSWQDALNFCRVNRQELASIQSAAENNFITSQAGKAKLVVWLGLNDLTNQMNFEWSDKSPVVFTKWAKGEPNNYHGRHEDCVALKYDGWNDFDCKDPAVTGFVCKTPQSIMAKTTKSPLLQGCKYNAFGYYGSCYQFVSSKTTWSAAEKYCVLRKGHLATINDRFVQSFLSSALSRKGGNFWIGLSDSGTPGRVHWSSKQKMYYTNWNRAHTGKEKSTCVAIGTGLPVGMWQNRKCSERNQFICEYPRTGFTNPPTTPRPTVQLNCPAEWFEFQGFCYKGFFAYATTMRKTWTEARDYCRAYGADLASLHSSDEEQFIVSPVLETNRYQKPGTYWIGMNDRAVQEGYEWSDGTPNDYVNWASGQPNNHNDQEDCVEFNKDTMKWNDANCALSKNFICKIRKGLRVKTTLNPQTFTNAPKCGGTSNWYLFNNNCYYNSYYGQEMSWFDARKYCLKQGGDLTSIHAQNESEFIISLVSKQFRTDYWIGLNELSLKDYEWTDGTPFNYRNWAPNEPNDYYGGERCVNMYNYNGEWNDNNCGQPLSFICKRSNGKNPSQTLKPTPPMKGGCPQGFTTLGPWSSKCFMLASDNDVQNWTNARKSCGKKYPQSELASISSYAEQMGLSSMLNGRRNLIWIGLNDLQRDNTFLWADNSEVRFTFWEKGQPDGVPKSYKNGKVQDCVGMSPAYWKPGRWSDLECGVKVSYLCQVYKNPTIPVATTNQPSFCNKPGYTIYGDSCYKLDTKARNWQTAKTFCQQDGGNLLTVTSSYEQALLLTFLRGKKTPFWIGLSDSQKSGTYVWSDGWPTAYTNWAKGEPSKMDGEGCVAMNPSGRWNDTQCQDTYPTICKITRASKPATTPLQMQRGCSKSYLIPSTVSNNCYDFEARSLETWSGAEYQCRRRGMHLVAIPSLQDLTFIQSFVSHNPNPYLNMWIGLIASDDGGFMWRDRRVPNDFTNWAESEPSNEVSGYAEDCVEMNPVTGQWFDQACSAKRGYICWQPKVTTTTRVTAAPVTNSVITGSAGQPVITPKPRTNPPWNPFQTNGQQTVVSGKVTGTGVVSPTKSPYQQLPNNSGSSGGLGAGAIAGIIIAVVLIVAGLVGAGLLIRFKQIAVFNIQRNRKSSSMSKGFDNALYSKSSGRVDVN